MGRVDGEQQSVDKPEAGLEPLPYHVELRDYLKSQERELWNWFASARAKAEYAEHLRMELLKSTYRLDAAGHPELYQGVEEAKVRLQLDIPVTIYQAQNNPQPNAVLFFMPGEGHVVFSGPVLTLLNAEEIKSVIGHELAHYHLWSRDGGEYHIADRLVQAVAEDPRAAASHEQTARRYQLYTEIFADRGALHVTQDVNPVVAGLVKIQTGLTQVSAAGYLKQAEEIFEKGSVATAGVSHPEAFIRARALALWQERREEASGHIAEMIEGAAALDELDLIGQRRLSGNTRRLLEYFLQPKWFQTAAVLGHAKMFFADFKPAATRDVTLLEGWGPPKGGTASASGKPLTPADGEREETGTPTPSPSKEGNGKREGTPGEGTRPTTGDSGSGEVDPMVMRSNAPRSGSYKAGAVDAKLREYVCFLLLDFVTADPELEDMPLVAALDLSRQLEFDAQFEKLAAKELKMKLRDVRKLKDQATEMLAKAEVAG